MFTRITANEVLSGCRQVLGLSPDQLGIIDEQLLSGLLRRSAGIHCPCSRATLRSSLLESLAQLSSDDDSLSERIDDSIEALIVGGDLLELNDVVMDDESIKGTWVFAAPPSFVERPSGGIFLFGVVPDQDTFLPSSIAGHIVNQGHTRVIRSQSGRNFIDELKELGLQQLSEKAWLKCPEAESARDMLNRFKSLLSNQLPPGTIHDLKILDHARPVTYYRGRWADPKKETGIFVSRRPQEFGSPIWCLTKLEEGIPVRLLDLPVNRSRWRGCDTAWHLQMAIDYCQGTPQQYRRIAENDDIRFDFFSPLPQWSQRRLMIIGRSVPPKKSLMAYLLPSSEAEAEEDFLQKMLWLSPTNESN